MNTLTPTRRPRRRQDDGASRTAKGPLTDFNGIALIALGTLLFLSLISFRAGELPDATPSWMVQSRAGAEPLECTNVFGPAGLYAARALLILLGGAAFIFPMGLIWLGFAKIMMRLRLLWRPTMGLLITTVAFAGLLGILSRDLVIEPTAANHAADQAPRFWEKYVLPGNGGFAGLLVRGMAIYSVGTVVGGILCVVCMLVGIVLSFGMRVMEALREVQRALDDWREKRWLAKEAAERNKLERQRQALREEREWAKEQREILRQERESKRQGRRAGSASNGDELVIPGREVAAALYTPELPFPVPAEESTPATPPRPAEPEIIDGTARKAENDSAERKMSLAEWRKARQSKNRGDSPSGMASALSPLSEAFKDYQLPDLDILHWDDIAERKPADKSALLATQQTIIRTLASFGVSVTPGTITRGPSITRYEIYPTDGLRVNKITQLEADIARATKAEFINILAPIPGKDTVGIEIANSDKVPVPLRELLEDPKFHKGKARIPLALGKDVYGETIIADLASMPHLLVAGTTGSGKSVCINSIIASLLFQFTPDQLRFIMVDPKVVEMQVFRDLPHLIVPVVTDPKKVLAALKWVVNEMEYRYRIFADEGVRNFDAFNSRKRKSPTIAPTAPKRSPKSRAAGPPASLEPELPLFDPLPPPYAAEAKPMRIDEDDPMLAAAAAGHLHSVIIGENDPDMLPEGLEDLPDDREGEDYDAFAALEEARDQVPDTVPYIVVIIDELADLMQTAPADVENLIARLTQKARAAGIHLIVATQTPRANVITGVIKANIPCRIAFQVASGLDSRVILDGNGAEKLVGKGDMLYLPPGTSKFTRAQGAFITDEEIHALVEHCKSQGKPIYDAAVQESIRTAASDGQEDEELTADDEELLEKCIEVIVQERIASTSRLQRRLKLGYTRAARMMDVLEQRGIVGPGDGAKPREILIALDDFEPGGPA